jgi:hypothetical protein
LKHSYSGILVPPPQPPTHTHFPSNWRWSGYHADHQHTNQTTNYYYYYYYYYYEY